MTVYAVFKEGVYRHECAGIFSALEAAKAVADKWRDAGDGHHSWTVVPFEVDVAAEGTADEPDWIKYGDNLAEPKAVYETKLPRKRPMAFT